MGRNVASEVRGLSPKSGSAPDHVALSTFLTSVFSSVNMGLTQEERDICVYAHIADSLHCTAETNTIL